MPSTGLVKHGTITWNRVLPQFTFTKWPTTPFFRLAQEQHFPNYDIICYNFAVNPQMVVQVAKNLLKPGTGLLLAPVNDRADYLLVQRILLAARFVRQYHIQIYGGSRRLVGPVSTRRDGGYLHGYLVWRFQRVQQEIMRCCCRVLFSLAHPVHSPVC
jgi:hypothetical protein